MSSRRLAHDLERALSGRSEVSADLRHLVETATLLRDVFAAAPRIAADVRAREAAGAAFLEAAIGHDEPSTIRRPRRAHRVLRRALIAAAALVLIPSAALAAAWPAAQRSLPGEPLYLLKLGVERARIALASGEGELGVFLDIADARIREAERAEAAGLFDAFEEALRRYADVVHAFDATIADLGGPPESSAPRAQDVFEHHSVVLTSLLERIPDVAVPGLRAALELAEGHGPPDDVPPSGGFPTDVPGEVGAGADAEDSEGSGSTVPDGSGPPVPTGPPPSASGANSNEGPPEDQGGRMWSPPVRRPALARGILLREGRRDPSSSHSGESGNPARAGNGRSDSPVVSSRSKLSSRCYRCDGPLFGFDGSPRAHRPSPFPSVSVTLSSD